MNTTPDQDPWDTGRLRDSDRDIHEHPERDSGTTPILLILIGFLVVVGLLIWGGLVLANHVLKLP
jgi:hypothetical protein